MMNIQKWEHHKKNKNKPQFLPDVEAVYCVPEVLRGSVTLLENRPMSLDQGDDCSLQGIQYEAEGHDHCVLTSQQTALSLASSVALTLTIL